MVAPKRATLTSRSASHDQPSAYLDSADSTTRSNDLICRRSAVSLSDSISVARSSGRAHSSSSISEMSLEPPTRRHLRHPWPMAGPTEGTVAHPQDRRRVCYISVTVLLHEELQYPLSGRLRCPQVDERSGKAASGDNTLHHGPEREAADRAASSGCGRHRASHGRGGSRSHAPPREGA